MIVVSWESAYNPPWNLLDAGYEVINASWKPLYVVGGGTPRWPHIGGRKWSWRELLEWRKDEFWHWQLGTPVFEDRGPDDPHRDDGRWLAPVAQREQILGGQLCFWEQREHTVLRDAWSRVPALAESLWTDADSVDPVGFRRRLDAVDHRVRSMIQPVRIRVDAAIDRHHPIGDDFLWFDRTASVALGTAGGDAGELGDDVVRFTIDGSPVSPTSDAANTRLRVDRRTTVRARLFRDGAVVGAETRVTLDPRAAKVRCSWFRLPRRPLATVPDFADRRRWRPERVDLLPELRGPYRTTHPVGQMLEATLRVAEDRAGRHAVRLQTRDGRAVLYVDGKRVAGPTDPREVKLVAELELAAGLHSIRVDHASGPISPVVIVAIRAPGQTKFVPIEQHLVEIPRGTEPQRLGPLTAQSRSAGRWFESVAVSSRARGARVAVDRVVSFEDGVLRIEGEPRGYLETLDWYRDYELELQWRWPGAGGGEPRGGNSGVLVHTTTPRLFYGWPRSLEVQLQHGAAGDFWTIGRDVSITVEGEGRRRVPERPGNLHRHRRIPRLGPEALERPLGHWNDLRVVCAGDEIVVFVNGIEVQRGMDASVRQGAVALQSEGAPIEFSPRLPESPFEPRALTSSPNSPASGRDWRAGLRYPPGRHRGGAPYP